MVAKDGTERAAFEPVNRWPEELRPRERILRDGVQALSDAELLAVLLRTGSHRVTVVDLARKLVAAHGGLAGLARLHRAEWERQSGIGPSKAATVMAAFELGRRTWSRRTKPEALATPEAVYRHMAPRFFHESHRETMWVLGLDARNRPVVDAVVGQGTADRAPAHAREVFAPLIRAGALKGILIHNHPSGDPEPSRSDRRLTERMVAAGALLGIPIVDHIVVGNDTFCSFHERGLMPVQ